MTKKVVTATWLKGITFDAEMLGHHLMIDGISGFGDDRGPRPMYLLLASLAGCTGMDVMSILKKSRQPVTDLKIHAEAEQAEEHPKLFTSISLHVEVHGKGIDRKAVERAVQLTRERYCQVEATLRQPPAISDRIEIIEPEDE